MLIDNVSEKYPKEHNQCVVIALTEVSKKEYELIYLFVQHTMNRMKNKTVQFLEIQKAKKMFPNIGLMFKKIKVSQGETISTFAEKTNQIGSYLLFSENHVSALIDGVLKDVVDDLQDLDQKILNVIKVK